jgi:hypothetical protein
VIARTHDVTRIGRLMIAMSALLAVVFAWTSGGRAASSALGGGLVAVANLYLIRTAVSRLIATPHRPAVGVGAVLIKLVLSMGMIAAAFARLPIEPIPFALGVSVLFAAVLVEALLLGSPVRGSTASHLSDR